MAIYVNNNQDEKSIFASVDFDDAHNTAFFFVKHEVDVDRAKQSLAAAGQSIIAQSYVKGHTVIITQGQGSKEELFGKISTAPGDKFELAKPEKKTSLQFIKENGWKLRGGSSVIGQSLTLFAAARGVSVADAAAGNLNPKFDPTKGFFAIFNLAANFINYVFGGQKEEDVKGLEKFDGIIADEVNHYLPNGAKQVSPEDVRKLSYMTDEELKEHNKDRSAAGILKRNSVRLGEVGLRTLGSICLMFNIRNWGAGFRELAKGEFKQAFHAAKTKDPFTFWAGTGMVAGKMMGLSAKTEDPNNPPKTYWDEIRQKVLWRVSSFTEMVAQSAFVYDEHRSKKIVWGGKAHYNTAGVAGNALLTVPPYPARLVLPYGKKVLDIDEVQARLLDELPKLPPEKVPEVMARVTARMVEHMGEDSPSFSELYTRLLNKAQRYHGISVLPYQQAGAHPHTESFAQDLMTKLENSPPIPDDAQNPAEQHLEKVQAEKRFVDQYRPQQIKDIVNNAMAGNGYVAGLDSATAEAVMAR